MNYKPDLSLFDDWDNVKDNTTDYPMIAVFEFGGKKLVYVGTQHNRKDHPAPRSYDAINYCFDNFKIDCVVTECDHTKTLDYWIPRMNRPGANELIYAPYLGSKQNIPYIFADSSDKDWVADVLKNNPGAIKDLQTFLILDEAYRYKNHFGKNETIGRAIYNVVHNFWRDSYPTPMTADEFIKHCKQHLGIDVTDENVSDILSMHPDWNRPGIKGNIINRAWSYIDMYSRDMRMLKNIFDVVNRYSCVLMTAGYGHLAKQRRVLEHSFGAPKIILDFSHTLRRDMPNLTTAQMIKNNNYDK